MAAQLRVTRAGKRYRHAALRNRTVRDFIVGGFRRRPGRSFWGLRDVSFEVERGSTLGIIGANGAGKSTLLRLLAGIGRPDEGEIHVAGRVAGIFEIGTGFHPELTGRECATLTGVISGLTRTEIRHRLAAITEFAELEHFLDDAVRTYSSGMVARLAFAVAVHVDADVLLVDEALAVGDLAFQAKCIDRLRAFRREGGTTVAVSHSPAALRNFCDDVVWLQGGRLVARGRPEDVTARYAAHMRDLARSITPTHLQTQVTPMGAELKPLENRVGSQEATIASVRVLDRWLVPAEELTGGDPLLVLIDIDAPAELGSLNLGLHIIRDDDGVLCVDASTVVRPSPDGRHRRTMRLEFPRLDLASGAYSCEVGLYSSDWSRPYDYHAGVYRLRVSGTSGGGGVLAPPVAWTCDASDPIAGGRSEPG
jgi:lipopolysaccharide transport system ATP-binding protein